MAGISGLRMGRGAQIVVAIILTGLVALNLRVIMLDDSLQREEDEIDKEPECIRQVVLSIEAGTDVKTMNASDLWRKWMSLDRSLVKVLGNQRQHKGFLTVGVPSIKRINGMTYLIQTINSLIETTSSVDKTSVVVIVFLGDFDTVYNDKVARALMEKYVDYINVGFLQVVQVSRSFYPQLSNLKHNFKDSEDRVSWRAKQVVDFSFMFMYAQNISDYYVQIEDDVICANDFVMSIRAFIEETDRTRKLWTILEFSELGFIGKLMKSSDLSKFAQYLMNFYEEQPVDWLAVHFRMSMAQRLPIMRKPTLFQHVGLKSSFDTSHDNRLKDRFFDSGQSQWKSDDPPGYIVSDMEAFKEYTPDMIYAAAGSYFWAKKPVPGNAITLVFDEPQLLDRVIAETGIESNPNDILLNGTLEVSPKFMKHDTKTKKLFCAQWHAVAKFENGRAYAENLQQELRNRETKCVRITVDVLQKDWIVFRQLAVYTVKKDTGALKVPLKHL